MVRKYAADHQNDYKIIWTFELKGKGDFDIENQFYVFAEHLNKYRESLRTDYIILGDRNNSEQRKNLVSQILNRLEKIKSDYLLIFDNAEDGARIKKYLPTSRGDSGYKKHIVITSRANATSWGKDNIIDLVIFNREESIELLQKSLFQDVKASKQDLQDLNNLAEKLHDYPLALSVASSYISSRKDTDPISIGDYMKLFEIEKEKLRRYEETVVKLLEGEEDGATVATTLELSFKAIKQCDKKDKKISDFLFMLTFLPHHRINEKLMKNILAKLGGAVNLDYAETIRQLDNHSLIKRIKDNSSRRVSYFMHEMVHEVIMDKMKHDKMSYKSYFIKDLDLLNGKMQEISTHREAIFYFELHCRRLDILRIHPYNYIWDVMDDKDRDILSRSYMTSKYDAEIIAVARNGNVSLLKHLVEKGHNINTGDHSTNETILHVLAKRKSLNVELYDFLLGKGADKELKSKCGETLLHYAVLGGNNELCARLISDSFDVNSSDNDGVAAIHLSVRHDEVEILSLLRANGADEKLESKDGKTLLHYAVLGYNRDLCERLIREGFDINALDKDLNTPLKLLKKYFCLRIGYNEFIKFLEERGARENICESLMLE